MCPHLKKTHNTMYRFEWMAIMAATKSAAKQYPTTAATRILAAHMPTSTHQQAIAPRLSMTIIMILWSQGSLHHFIKRLPMQAMSTVWHIIRASFAPCQTYLAMFMAMAKNR